MANPYSNIWLAVLQTKGVVDLPERIPSNSDQFTEKRHLQENLARMGLVLPRGKKKKRQNYYNKEIGTGKIRQWSGVDSTLKEITTKLAK